MTICHLVKFIHEQVNPALKHRHQKRPYLSSSCQIPTDSPGNTEFSLHVEVCLCFSFISRRIQWYYCCCSKPPGVLHEIQQGSVVGNHSQETTSTTFGCKLCEYGSMTHDARMSWCSRALFHL